MSASLTPAWRSSSRTICGSVLPSKRMIARVDRARNAPRAPRRRPVVPPRRSRGWCRRCRTGRAGAGAWTRRALRADDDMPKARRGRERRKRDATPLASLHARHLRALRRRGEPLAGREAQHPRRVRRTSGRHAPRAASSRHARRAPQGHRARRRLAPRVAALARARAATSCGAARESSASRRRRRAFRRWTSRSSPSSTCRSTRAGRT